MSLRRIYTKQIGDYPKGFHIHHIKPRCEGGDERRGNLIALHPDDHFLIHKMRGDKILNKNFILMSGHTNLGRKWSEESKNNQSSRMRGEGNNRFGTSHSEGTLSVMSSLKKGLNHPGADQTKYWWCHPTLGEVLLTRYEMTEKYGTRSSHLEEVIFGKAKQHKGWKLKGVNYVH